MKLQKIIQQSVKRHMQRIDYQCVLYSEYERNTKEQKYYLL